MTLFQHFSKAGHEIENKPERGLGPFCPGSVRGLCSDLRSGHSTASPHRMVAGSPASQKQAGSWCPAPVLTRPACAPAGPWPAQLWMWREAWLWFTQAHSWHSHCFGFLCMCVCVCDFFSHTPPTPFLKNAVSFPRGFLWAAPPGGKLCLDFLEQAELVRGGCF